MSAQWSAVSGQPSGSRAVELVTACLLGAVCGVLPGCATPKPMMMINVPVVDLRAQPHTSAVAETHDPFQETQLLYGEPVRLIRTEEEWAFVEAIEQREFTHQERWQGYPGWIRADLLAPLPRPHRPNAIVTVRWATVWQDSHALQPQAHLAMGTKALVTSTAGELWRLELVSGEVGWVGRGDVTLIRALRRLPVSRKRQAVVRTADEFLGDPYFWGGRSPYAGPSHPGVTGVDCSGLVNLAYRTVGMDVPRDAHEQYLCARRIRRLEPADLIFLSERNNPKKIVHVMLYAGDGWLIEGPGTGQAVRRIAITKRLGESLDWLSPGAVVEDQTVFFGTYFP